MKKRVWNLSAAVVDHEVVGLDLVCDSRHMYDTEYKSTAGDSQNSM
jgi:hypothetical protein